MISSLLLPLSVWQIISKPAYAALTAVVAIPLWILFNMFDQLLFFQPIWTFYIPEDAILGFILTTMVSILLGILVSMNAYVIKHSGMRINKASLFSGSALGIISGVCSSCSSIGFLLISTFGTIGVIASDFLTIYQAPLRIVCPRDFRSGLAGEEKKIKNPELSDVLASLCRRLILKHSEKSFSNPRGRPISSSDPSNETRGRKSYYEIARVKQIIDQILDDHESFKKIDNAITGSDI
jgi:hypothetical protein